MALLFTNYFEILQCLQSEYARTQDFHKTVGAQADLSLSVYQCCKSTFHATPISY